MSDVSLNDILVNVKELSASNKFSSDPMRRFGYLTSEIGEVGDEVLITTDSSVSAAKRTEAIKNLGPELFDVIWNCVALASTLDIDLNEAAREKMKFNGTRDFKSK